MIIDITQDAFFYLGTICFLYVIYLKHKRKKIEDKLDILIKLCFGLYIIKVLALVFFPIKFGLEKYVTDIKPTIWINPLESYKYILSSNSLYGIIYNIGGNLILLMPLPIFLIYFYKQKINSLKKILLICFFISFSIECMQYIESILIPSVGRFFETNDILLNTIGGGIGYSFYIKNILKIL